MFYACLISAISSSIDSLGIGITYGIKNTKITFSAKLILFIISLCVSTMSISIGNFISSFLPNLVCNIIGFLMLIFMGIFIIFQSFKKTNQTYYNEFNKQGKMYSFFIKPFGITIQIIKNPINSDLDNSKKIDAKEALYLGIALSLDCFCIGLGNAMLGITSFVFPLLVSIFQLVFLSCGLFLGIKLKSITNIPDNIWSIISGLLLIFIGLSKLY